MGYHNKVKDSLLEIVWNPIYLCEHSLRSKLKKIIINFKITSSDKWLDVGCGLRPYEGFFPEGTYIGVDVDSSGRDHTMKSPDHFYDGHTLPFPDNSFEGVISTQVLEHVPDPQGLLVEMYRVLKPGGRLIMSLPFIWQEHEQPYDYFRFTRYGVDSLLKQIGFEVNGILKDTGSIEMFAVMFNSYILHNLSPPIRGMGRLITLMICFPVQLIALILQRILPDNGDLYLNIVVWARKL